MKSQIQQLSIDLEKGPSVSALWLAPTEATACFVFAHGAGAGMTHPFMSAVAQGLHERSIATLRYQFPYMDKGMKRPDAPAVCHATVRAAVRQATCLRPQLPVFAGGKSFGGRMTSQAQAIDAMPDAQGLIFLGFPLHKAGQPDAQRAQHLSKIAIPMLFLQGDRDALAEAKLLKEMTQRLEQRATLKFLQHADHSFHVLARSGITDEQTLQMLLDALSEWIESGPG